METLSRLRLAQAFNIFIRSVEISSQAVTEHVWRAIVLN